MLIQYTKPHNENPQLYHTVL